MATRLSADQESGDLKMATHMSTHSVQTLDTSSLLNRGKMMLMTWFERARSRRELAELPPHLLKDIGLTESDRFVESNKPFWRD